MLDWEGGVERVDYVSEEEGCVSYSLSPTLVPSSCRLASISLPYSFVLLVVCSSSGLTPAAGKENGQRDRGKDKSVSCFRVIYARTRPWGSYRRSRSRLSHRSATGPSSSFFYAVFLPLVRALILIKCRSKPAQLCSLEGR